LQALHMKRICNLCRRIRWLDSGLEWIPPWSVQQTPDTTVNNSLPGTVRK
jgi:hypothetical protein